LINELKDDWLCDLVTLSCIAAEKTFENFFKNNLNGEMASLDEQPFIKILKDLPKPQKIEIIMKNINGNLSKPKVEDDNLENQLI
jgi:hypothetical protein